jgi:asparagine synthase (glutamine-hydrolysing)
MCGLIGAVNLPLGAAELDLIAHRGPDGEGLLTRAVGGHQVSLGHRRLAIVDLSANGAQPMQTADGRHALVFNGEIYNHTDLRSRLAGVAFRGHSDTETLLHLMAAEGSAAVADLNGIFAFAWLDVAAARLVLARDPFGVKPVYYAVHGGGLCFASELAPLLRLVPREVDRQALTTLLKLRFTPSPQTLFRGIRRLRPGHLLEVNLSGPAPVVRELPYVGRLAGVRDPGGGSAAATRLYGEHFETAVRRQLMSDVEVGVLLSGGVDSALVAAIAQRHASRPLKAFTVGFTGEGADEADEIADAAATARALGMEHLTVRIGFDNFLEALRDCVAVVEEPLATTSIVPMRYLARLAAGHVKVVLSGQGADEPLGGYGRYQGELYAGYVPPGAARLLRAVARGLGLRGERVNRGLDALSADDDVGRFLEAHAVFRDDEIRELTGKAPEGLRSSLEYFYGLLGCAGLPAPVERMMALDLRLGLADDLLLYTDKITMRSSLECRVPILDLDLIRFIETLPASYRVGRGQGKIVHRAYARTVLPGAIVDRPKKGFWSPTRVWFRDESRLRAILLDPASRFAGYFDLEAVGRTIREHQQGYNRERHIFLLLALYFWLSLHG